MTGTQPTSATAITQVQPDLGLLSSFFSSLYKGATSGALAISVAPSMRTQFFSLGESGAARRAAQFAASEALSSDTYFGVGLRREDLKEGRGDSQSVVALPALWIDVDIASPAHKGNDLPPDEHAAMEIVRTAELVPTALIKSGHGFHGYWIFREIQVLSEATRGEMQERCRAWQRAILEAARKKGWRLDNTSDLSRILRPPGTVNRKVPGQPEAVTFEVTGPRYTLDEIDGALNAVLTRFVGLRANGSARSDLAGDSFVGEGPGARPTDGPPPCGFVGFAGEGKTQQPGDSSIDRSFVGCEPEGAPTNVKTSGNAEGFDGTREVPETKSGNSQQPEIRPILDGCAWLRHCLSEAATLSEPEWYAALSVVGRCKDGQRLAHEFSKPYSRYSFDETEKKLQHALNAAGPVKCATVERKLGQHNLCTRCPSYQRVNSPIILGRYPTGTASDNKKTENPPESPWPAPRPLKSALPKVPEFDANLLPGGFRDYAVDVAERMQVPLDFAAAGLIVALAGAVGRRALITPKQHDHRWTVVPNLWGGIVSRPGNLKTPLITEVFSVLHSMEKVAIDEHTIVMQDYQRELDGWEARKKAAYGRGGTHRFDEPKPERPPGLRFMVNDATVEKLHAILLDNPQGLLLYRDELAGWFATLDTKGRERDRPFFLEAWNGNNPFTVDRIGRGTLHVPHLCLSVFGGVQPSKLQNYLNDAVLGGCNDDGLIQRLQVVVYPDQLTTWRNVDREPDSRAANAVEEVFREIPRMSSDEPLRARFSPDAQQLFDEWHRELELRLRKGDLPGFFESHLAKFRSLMPSIALLLHIADGSREEEIPLVQAQRSAAWCEYLEAHAQRVYSCVINADDRAAATLGEHLRKGDLSVRFTVRDVYLKGWSGLGKAEQVRRALAVLQEAHWVRAVPWAARPGRPTEEYDVNPGVYRAER